MKPLKFVLILTCFIVYTCKQDTSKTVTEIDTEVIEVTPAPSLEGAWELVGYYNYEDDKVKDSTKASVEHRQIKMYTKNKMMWSKKRPADDTEWFAYGSYSLEGNTLTEVLEYGSLTMAPIMKEHGSFIYEVILGDNTFSQIELDEDGHKIYSENYKRVE